MTKSQLLPITPLLEKENFYLKREDLNPSGSVKDRAVVAQLAWAKKEGYQEVAASSSGNFGLSLGYWTRYFNLRVVVFVSPKTNKNKIFQLQKYSLDLKISKKPISDCFRYCKKTGALNLRQSKDPQAIVGFFGLGEEVADQVKKGGLTPKSIFFPVSSGTTLLGVVKGMEEKGLDLAPFLVQPASHPLLGKIWDQDFRGEKEKLVDALVAKVIPQRFEILRLIKKYRGGGVVVQNKDILKWSAWLEKQGVSTSYEGALSLAGVEKAKKLNLIKKGEKAICLLTGRKY